MDELSLQFLPFPHVYNGERQQGMTHAWLDRCQRCDRQCERSESKGIGLCSYGVNFLRVDDSLLIAGIVVKDDERASGARSKMLRIVGKDAVPRAHVLAVLASAKKATEGFAEEISTLKAEVVTEYRESGGYKKDLVELLKPTLEKTFAQMHDYRQLTTQIVQHVNVLLQNAFPGVDLDVQLERADPSLRSIYWSARLMEFKLDSALFLTYPARISDPNKKRGFRFHGSVRKYLSIYAPVMEQRRLRLRQVGESYGSLMANPDAVGVIPHAFLDNAIKYAPDRSEIVIEFQETDREIVFSVGSLGPKIAEGEFSQLFELFYRAQGAKDSSEDGTGFGLGLAQHVANELGVRLWAKQEKPMIEPGLYRTVFSASFPKPSPEDRPDSLVNARNRVRGGAA
jgi:hypothetical protein